MCVYQWCTCWYVILWEVSQDLLIRIVTRYMEVLLGVAVSETCLNMKNIITIVSKFNSVLVLVLHMQRQYRYMEYFVKCLRLYQQSFNMKIIMIIWLLFINPSGVRGTPHFGKYCHMTCLSLKLYKLYVMCLTMYLFMWYCNISWWGLSHDTWTSWHVQWCLRQI